MSFSGDVKRELVRQMSSARHCQIAEFAAIFAMAGRIRCTKGGRHYLEIRTENLTVAMKSDMLVRKMFHNRADLAVWRNNDHPDSRNYLLQVWEPDKVVEILKAMKVMDEMGMIRSGFTSRHRMLTQNTCCKRAFLRGLFLASGSVTDPEKAYHLEMSFVSPEIAQETQTLLQSFSLEAKIVCRKNYYVVYLKEGSQIVDFLNVVEAHVALMAYENVRILKDMRNSLNRQVNCETANIGKTVVAASRQIDDITLIEKIRGFGTLKPGLRQVAELRLEYPDASLLELGQMLVPPLGKSGVNHRLRKLGEIADSIRDESN